VCTQASPTYFIVLDARLDANTSMLQIPVQCSMALVTVQTLQWDQQSEDTAALSALLLPDMVQAGTVVEGQVVGCTV